MMPPPLAEPDDRLAPLAGAAAAPRAADEAATATAALAPGAAPGGAAPGAASEPRELVIQGLPVSPGVAIQNALVVHAESVEIAERFVKPDEVDDALLRYELALQVALGEVRELQVRYAEVLGSDTAQIFRAHELMLADKGLGEDIRRKIQANRFSPEYAVSRAFQSRIAQIRAVQNEFIRQREIDLHDVERRLLRALFGQRQEEAKSVTGEVCLVAHDLTPSQAATLDTTKIVGFALDLGGRTSHTAIVARALGIPAVVGLGRASSAISTNDPVIIDGTKGRVIVHPRPETLKAYQARRTQFIEFTRDLADLRGLPAETLDGYRVTIHANIEFPEEIKAALDGGAEGIGLYRTEFLYAQGVPDEARHFQAYRGAVELLDGRALVVRTLDLGADKFAEHLYPEPEPNPFLGCRSIRYCFQHPAAFRTQLRAILRASAYGPIKLMLPMITTRNEVRRAKRVIEEVKQELEHERIPFDDRIPVGIMVEVPSAALIADILATECAFLSIGTNDLVQYALAVDRMNERVADLYQPAHPAVLRLIRAVIEAGHKHGVEVSMCGEMSGEALYTIPLVGMGLRTFSISPGSVPEVKKVLRSVTFRECGEVVDKIFEFGDANDTDSYLRDKAAKIIPELF